MKKLITIIAAIVYINAGAQTKNALVRNGLARIDSLGNGLDSINGQCFGTAVNYPATSTNPKSLVGADFNNDGKLDVAGTNYGADHVFVLLGTGTGTFGAATSFSICAPSGSPSNFSSICSADFNNDGKADLAVGNPAMGSIYILLGTGTGSFGAITSITVGTSPYWIVSADFNADTFKDLAVADNTNHVYVLLGNGTGIFSTPTSFAVGTYPMSVCTGDFNGDTKLDLAVANYSSNNISILLGTGTGSFNTSVNFPAVVDIISITSADFNNDGKLDLAGTNSADSICIILGTGTGNFGTPTKYYTAGMGYPYQGQIISADFNGDGNMDLAKSDYGAGSGYASVFLGTGTGSFGAAGDFATGSNPVAVVAADFNMDGKLDLATANSSNYNVSILLNHRLDTISIAANTTTLCGGSGVTLTASGSTTYSWSTSATTASISVAPTSNTTYYVTDGIGCSNTVSISINVSIAAVPAICMVTTDSATNYNYNIIYWDKTPYANVDSFIVYRYDAISSSYLRIGAVNKSALSAFTDTAFSIGGPNGGNPLYASWKYTLAIRDTCGNIGAMSPYHQTMFVQESGANFSWNAYVASGQSSLPTGYSFLRDDNNTGNWHVLVTVTSLSTTDPNYASYPNGNWRVDALGFNCTPTMRLAGNNNTYSTYSKSHSNPTKSTITGINQITNNNAQISIYPNPTTGVLNIEGLIPNSTLQITDVLGNEVITTKQSQVDVNNLQSGVYFIKTTQGTSKFVKQ